MTFPRIRAPGLWVLGSVVSPAEMELFDQHQFQALDGYGGGVYALLAPLVLGQGVGNTTAAIHVTGHAILDDFEGHVRSGFSVQIEGGATLGVSNGGSVQVEAGGSVNVLDGGHVILNPDGGSGGSVLIVGGQAFFNHNSLTLIQGTSGNAATFQFGHDSSLIFQGTSGHEARVFLDSHSAVAINTGATIGDGGTWTRTGPETRTAGETIYTGGGTALTFQSFAGAEFKTSSLLFIDSGCNYRQRADNNRTGADIPSGAGAVSYLRPAVTGPNVTTSIDISLQDVIRIPTGIASPIAWGLIAPAGPCRCTIVSPSAVAQGADVGIGYNSPVLGSYTVVTFAASGSVQSSCEIVYDGTYFFAVGPVGSATSP